MACEAEGVRGRVEGLPDMFLRHDHTFSAEMTREIQVSRQEGMRSQGLEFQHVGVRICCADDQAGLARGLLGPVRGRRIAPEG